MTGDSLILLTGYLPALAIGALWGYRLGRQAPPPKLLEGPVVAGQWFWIARVGEFRVDVVKDKVEVKGTYHRSGQGVSIPLQEFRLVATPCEAPPDPPLPKSRWTLPDNGELYVVCVTDKRTVKLSPYQPPKEHYRDWVHTFELPLWQFQELAMPVVPALESKS